jgi:predicted alpha/beta hydrolase family esterase
MAAGVLSTLRVLVAPGLQSSGPEHWQSRWQRLHPGFTRIEQGNWDDPDLAAWSARVDQVRAQQQRPTLVLAHSFGALATVHSVARDPTWIAGLLLVAPADPDKFDLASQLPHGRLPCPSIMLGSSNDPWMAADHAESWAARWGSEFANLGALGHINAESGLGDWPEGQRWLYKLAELAHNECPTILVD